MSDAPRTIWVVKNGHGQERDMVTARGNIWDGEANSTRYHHDAVVRELRKVADAYAELVATVRGECPSLLNEDSGGSHVLMTLVIDADAALAKIAQEGKP